MICTLYSRELAFSRILELLQKHYPEGHLSIKMENGRNVLFLRVQRWLLSSPQKLTITYRQRKTPADALPEIAGCDLTAELKELYAQVSAFPAIHADVKKQFLQKIEGLNSEFTVEMKNGEADDVKMLVGLLANAFDAVIRAEPGSLLSKTNKVNFLNKNLNLIIDSQGRCEILRLENLPPATDQK